MGVTFTKGSKLNEYLLIQVKSKFKIIVGTKSGITLDTPIDESSFNSYVKVGEVMDLVESGNNNKYETTNSISGGNELLIKKPSGTNLHSLFIGVKGLTGTHPNVTTVYTAKARVVFGDNALSSTGDNVRLIRKIEVNIT